MGVILWCLLATLLVFVAVILFRTLQFKPMPVAPANGENIQLNEEKIVADMQEMIRCKTISYNDESLIDRAEYAKFEALLKESFPQIHGACEFTKVGKTGLLYRLPGKSDAKPSVMMAHYDVVPIEEAGWDKPAFEGILEDGVIWGRGTLDTKGTLFGVL